MWTESYPAPLGMSRTIIAILRMVAFREQAIGRWNERLTAASVSQFRHLQFAADSLAWFDDVSGCVQIHS
jgi:hypothetical protein